MEKLYPHPGIRPVTDVDILIRKEDYGKLEKILKNFQGEIIAKKPYAAVFGFSDSVKVNIDISWNLLAIGRFIRVCQWSDEKLWERVEKKAICGADVFLLSKEDTLFLLIYHQAFQHCFRNFLGYLDIAYLINQGVIDWDFFLKRVIKLGLLGVAKKELEFCQDYLGAKVPKEIVLSLKGKIWSKIVFRGFDELSPRNLNLSCPHLVDWLRQPFFWDRFIQVGKSFFYSLPAGSLPLRGGNE